MNKLSKILTFWIPLRGLRHHLRDRISNICRIRKDWVVFYDTFSKTNNGDSIRPLAIELRKQRPDLKFFFVAKEQKEVDMADEVLVLGTQRSDFVLKRAKYLFTPMDFPTHKNRGQKFIMIWHGSPLKKLYLSREHSQEFIKYTNSFRIVDMFCYSADIFLPAMCEAFNLPENMFIRTGLPRNDILITNNNSEYINKIKKQLGIPLNKQVLFYCPTWRRADLKQPNPLNLDKLKQDLGDDFVLLLRSHVGKHDWVDENGNKISLDGDDFAFDVGNYENISDLYLISDILITDYSSSVFDFAILNRPQILYAYDLDEYKKSQGLYFDYHKFSPFPVVDTQNDLVAAIKNIDSISAQALQKFKATYTQYEIGTASQQIIQKSIN